MGSCLFLLFSRGLCLEETDSLWVPLFCFSGNVSFILAERGARAEPLDANANVQPELKYVRYCQLEDFSHRSFFWWAKHWKDQIRINNIMINQCEILYVEYTNSISSSFLLFPPMKSLLFEFYVYSRECFLHPRKLKCKSRANGRKCPC